MRDAFVSELVAVAERDSRLVVLSGDIGNTLFDEFKRRFPTRFYNCGIAEANMTGLAAGLALCGLRPVTYTIAAFNTVRCLEQIRVDLCYHKAPVVVVGVGGGLSYAELGPTHHACEDVALMRALPNMTVLCPGDPVEARLCLRAAMGIDGPCYIRLGKKGEPILHSLEPDFRLDRPNFLRAGADVCVIACGTVLAEAVKAREILEQDGLSTAVVSMPCVKPLAEDFLAACFERFRLAVTVEEHSIIGGLGAAVAEWLADGPDRACRLLRLAAPDAFFPEAGGQAYARRRLGLTGEAIAAAVQARLDQTSRSVRA